MPQARFYLEHAGQSFDPIAARHAHYHSVLERVREALPRGLKSQVIERAFLPQFSFGEADLVMTVGPDGLVVNVAKYLQGQPVFALNPDPGSIDGVLLAFSVAQFGDAFQRTLHREQNQIFRELLGLLKAEGICLTNYADLKPAELPRASDLAIELHRMLLRDR